jgi:hypothetical protein
MARSNARATLTLALGLALSAPVSAAESFLCRGDDPTWELGGSGGSTVLKLDGKGRSLVGAVTSLSAEGVVVWRGRGSDEPGEVVAVMIEGACIDDKDGRTGPHAAVLSLPGPRALVGCCSFGGQGAEAAAAPAQPPAADGGTAALTASGKARVRGPASKRVNVRSQPELKASQVVARLPGGTEVTITEQREVGGQAWYRVEAPGLTGPGWIRGDLLAPAAAADAEGAPEPEPSPPAAPATPAGGKATEDWSRHVVELMPAIRACLDATPTKPVTVTKAWPMNRGMVGVRLRNGRGQRLECVVPGAGGRPASYKTLAPAARLLPGEGQPVLTPGARLKPAGKCWRNEPVTLPGETRPAGTLSYLVC